MNSFLKLLLLRNAFFQLGNLWDLQIESIKIEYSSEEINTGPEILGDEDKFSLNTLITKSWFRV